MIRIFNQYASLKGALCALCEILLILFAPLCAAWIRFWAFPGMFEVYTESGQFPLQCCVFAAVFFVSFYLNGLYNLRKPLQLNQTFDLTRALGVGCLLLATVYFLFPTMLLGRGVFFIALVLVVISVICTRTLGAAFWQMMVAGDNTIVLGTGSLAMEIARALKERDDLATKLVGFVETGRGCAVDTMLGYPVLGTLAELEEIVATHQIRRVVVAIDERRGVLPIRQLVRFKVEGILVEEAQSVIAALTGHVRLETLLPSWLVFSDGFKRSRLTLIAKRTSDLVFGITGFILALPLMVLTAIAIKLDSKGPVFYRQKRVGYKDRVFEVVKFRSMRVDAESNGAQWASAEDPRITRVGRIIRRFRVDEVPQFINVIRGEMSFVGPRPERPVFVEQLRQQSPYYDQRHSVRPGITGWAQVQYRYAACVNDAYVKLEYDLFYLQNMSTLFDLLIVLKTVRTVLITGEQALPLASSSPDAVRLPGAGASSAQAKSAVAGASAPLRSA